MDQTFVVISDSVLKQLDGLKVGARVERSALQTILSRTSLSNLLSFACIPLDSISNRFQQTVPELRVAIRRFFKELEIMGPSGE